MKTPTLFDLVNPELAPDAAETFGRATPCCCPWQPGAPEDHCDSVSSGAIARGVFCRRAEAAAFSVTHEAEARSLPRKGVASTSLTAYRDIQDSLPSREAAVLVGLRRYQAVHGRWPTSYELYRAMAAEGYAFDLNSVRPRLTALWGKGHVIQTARRRCTVTGKRAYVWAVDEEG